MILDTATYTDIPDLAHMVRMFGIESHRDASKFHFEKAYQSLFRMVEDPNVTILVLRDGPKIGAMAILNTDAVFSLESAAYLYVFYVAPDYRGAGVGRTMVEGVLQACRELEVSHIYASSTAGFDDGGNNEKLFTNLFGKYGFKPLGTCMYKAMNIGPEGIDKNV